MGILILLRTLGPAAVLEVKKGDNVTISAFSLYKSTGTNFTLQTNATLGTVTGMALGEAVAGTAFSGLGVNIMPIFSALSASRPHAYAKLALLDKNGNILQEQYVLVASTTNAWQPIALTMKANTDGYLVAYVANESKMDVYFDDIEVKHDRLVWQENNYYPFGLAIKPLDREGLPEHRWKFTGKEEETEIGLIDFGWRQYDPAIAKWGVVDQWAEKYHTTSPYAFVSNNPVSNREIDGRYFVGTDGEKVKMRRRHGQIEIRSGNASDDLKTLVSAVNESGGKLGGKQVMKAARNSTKTHVKINNDAQEEGDLGFKAKGLHQAHDVSGKALVWDDKTEQFIGGTPAYIGKGKYKEATITIFTQNMSSAAPGGVGAWKAAGRILTKTEDLAGVFIHETLHNTDNQFISYLRKRIAGVAAPKIDDHQNINPYMDSFFKEIGPLNNDPKLQIKR